MCSLAVGLRVYFISVTVATQHGSERTPQLGGSKTVDFGDQYFLSVMELPSSGNGMLMENEIKISYFMWG